MVYLSWPLRQALHTAGSNISFHPQINSTKAEDDHNDFKPPWDGANIMSMLLRKADQHTNKWISQICEVVSQGETGLQNKRMKGQHDSGRYPGSVPWFFIYSMWYNSSQLRWDGSEGCEQSGHITKITGWALPLQLSADRVQGSLRSVHSVTPCKHWCIRQGTSHPRPWGWKQLGVLKEWKGSRR